MNKLECHKLAMKMCFVFFSVSSMVFAVDKFCSILANASSCVEPCRVVSTQMPFVSQQMALMVPRLRHHQCELTHDGNAFDTSRYLSDLLDDFHDM